MVNVLSIGTMTEYQNMRLDLIRVSMPRPTRDFRVTGWGPTHEGHRITSCTSKGHIQYNCRQHDFSHSFWLDSTLNAIWRCSTRHCGEIFHCMFCCVTACSSIWSCYIFSTSSPYSLIESNYFFINCLNCNPKVPNIILCLKVDHHDSTHKVEHKFP